MSHESNGELTQCQQDKLSGAMVTILSILVIMGIAVIITGVYDYFKHEWKEFIK